MKTFEHFLKEASLARFVSHLQSNPIAIVSAERSELSSAENKRNTKHLHRLINSGGFGFAKASGGYVEINDKTKRKVYVKGESSSIIYGTEQTEKQLLTFAIATGIKFKQDSILFIDSKHNAFWISTRNDSMLGRIGTRKPLGKFHSTEIGKYYSEIGKKRFSFETIDESTEPIKYTTVEMRSNDAFRAAIKKCSETDVTSLYDTILKQL